MEDIKKVALLGAFGYLGKHILKALIRANKFNITILSRPTSDPKAIGNLPSITIRKVDYESPTDLEHAFRGQDAIISALPMEAIEFQIPLVHAAIAAHVPRFLPSEYGSDITNPLSASLPVFQSKIRINQHLASLAATHPGFSYTLIRTNALIDWGLENHFLFQLNSAKPRIFNGGDIPFSCKTVETAAQAVMGTLMRPHETSNRAVYVHDFRVSQNQILEIAKSVAPERKWMPSYETLTRTRERADERLKMGDLDALDEYLYVAVFGEGFGGCYYEDDNALLGIQNRKTERDLEAIIQRVMNR